MWGRIRQTKTAGRNSYYNFISNPLKKRNNGKSQNGKDWRKIYKVNTFCASWSHHWRWLLRQHAFFFYYLSSKCLLIIGDFITYVLSLIFEIFKRSTILKLNYFGNFRMTFYSQFNFYFKFDLWAKNNLLFLNLVKKMSIDHKNFMGYLPMIYAGDVTESSNSIMLNSKWYWDYN